MELYNHTWSAALPHDLTALHLQSGEPLTDDLLERLPPSTRLTSLTLPPKSTLSAAGLARLVARYPTLRELGLLGLGALDRASVEALQPLPLTALKVKVTPAAASALDTLPHLTQLTLNEDLFSGKQAPQLKQLTQLRLFKIEVDKKLAQGLARLPALERLEITMTKPSGKAPLVALGGAPALQTLSLWGYAPLHAQELEALRGCASLKRLQTSAEDAATVEALAPLATTLDRLALHASKPNRPDLVEAIVAHLPHLFALQLNLYQSKSNAVPPAALAQLARLTQLRWVSLDRCILIKPEDITWLAQLPQLQELNLNNNTKLSGKIADTLAACAQLRSLILPVSNLPDAAIKKLVNLPLEHLSLHSDKATPKVFPLLAQLSQLKRLDLKLSIELDDASVRSLGALKQLEALRLTNPSKGNHVTTVAPLAALPHLRELALQIGHVPAALTELAAAPALESLVLSRDDAPTDAEALALRASPALRRLQDCPPRADLQPHVHITQEVEMTLPSLTPHLYNPSPIL